MTCGTRWRTSRPLASLFWPSIAWVWPSLACPRDDSASSSLSSSAKRSRQTHIQHTHTHAQHTHTHTTRTQHTTHTHHTTHTCLCSALPSIRRTRSSAAALMQHTHTTHTTTHTPVSACRCPPPRRLCEDSPSMLLMRDARSAARGTPSSSSPPRPRRGSASTPSRGSAPALLCTWADECVGKSKSIGTRSSTSEHVLDF